MVSASRFARWWTLEWLVWVVCSRSRYLATTNAKRALRRTPADYRSDCFYSVRLLPPACAAVLMVLVIQCYFASPMRGSILLFLVGTFIYQFSTAGIGILLATVSRSVPQLGLLCILVIVPIAFLSGAWMPAESLPDQMKMLMSISPLTYYSEFANAVVFRGAGMLLLWPQLLAMAAIGAVCFSYAMIRLRSQMTISRA